MLQSGEHNGDDDQSEEKTEEMKRIKKGALKPLLNLQLQVPSSDPVPPSDFMTESGTFVHGDLLVNKDGVRIISQSEVEAPPLIQPSDNEMNLDDFKVVRFLGQGNGGIVHLVQHKWTGQFFAVKGVMIFYISHHLFVRKTVICCIYLCCLQSALHISGDPNEYRRVCSETYSGRAENPSVVSLPLLAIGVSMIMVQSPLSWSLWTEDLLQIS